MHAFALMDRTRRLDWIDGQLARAADELASLEAIADRLPTGLRDAFTHALRTHVDRLLDRRLIALVRDPAGPDLSRGATAVSSPRGPW